MAIHRLWLSRLATGTTFFNLRNALLTCTWSKPFRGFRDVESNLLFIVKEKSLLAKIVL